MTALPRFAALIALTAASLAQAADTPMSAAEFEAYTTGKTLTFFSQGQPYGVERYKEDRRVTWSFLDGQCKEGTWYADGPSICFVYEDNPTPQCWLFFRQPDGLSALFEGEPGQTELYSAGESTDDMLCLGPDVGV